MFTPYKECSRDEPADCACGRPLAGDNDTGVCYQCRRVIAWSLGKTIMLPKGHAVGMGKLKKATEAIIIRIEKREDGSTFYCVRMENGQYTYI